MEPKLQKRVQRYGWDAASSVYEMAWKSNLLAAHDLMFELAGLEPGEAVVDVACGSGLISFRSAKSVGADGSVVATDISAEMVDLVAREAKRQGCETVDAYRMDAERLDFGNDRFDVALCALGLMYAPDPAAALKEMWRILRPGGRAIVSVWGARRNCGWAEIFPIVDNVVQSEVCPLFFGLGAGDALQLTMEKVGFGDVDTHRLQTSLRYASDEAVLSAVIDGGPAALAAKRFDQATRKKVETAFLASIEPYRNDTGQYEVPGQFIVASGRKAAKR